MILRPLVLLFASLLALAAEASTYYLDTYDEARAAFRALAVEAAGRVPGAESGALAVPSATEPDLTVDWIYLPPRGAADGLVVVSSGVHGAEAYAGSAVQRMLLAETILGGGADRERTGYLLIHAVNPYGFRHGRRATEGNVDLNRNFGVDASLFATESPGYDGLAALLAPKGPASAGWLSQARFLGRAAMLLARESVGSLTQAIAQGQYRHPRGLFYGGATFEPQVAAIERLVLDKARGYRKALVLDLHTGFGRRGFMHLLPNPPASAREAALMAEVFGAYPIEASGDGGDFYSSAGDFATYLAALLGARGVETVPMLIEFGTVDSQTLSGSLRSLRRVVLENQAHFEGAASPADLAVIRADYRELFYPSAPTWRDAVLSQAREHVPGFLARFAAMAYQKGP